MEKKINIQEIQFADIANENTALEDFYYGRRDGFLIRNVLSQEEVKLLTQSIDDIGKREMAAHVGEGFTYPTIFQEYTFRISDLAPSEQEKKKEYYFEYCKKFKDEFNAKIGMDLPNRLAKVLQVLGGNRNIKHPGMEGYDGHFPFGTMRYFNTLKGGISIHCGNYFQTMFQDFYEPLQKDIFFKNQLSYFFLLQKPDFGGELRVFNFRWEDGQSKSDTAEDVEVLLSDGSKYAIDSDPNMYYVDVAPNPGDMIVFQGGSIWHRVNRVKGSIPRITFGGFLGFSKDMNDLYVWS